MKAIVFDFGQTLADAAGGFRAAEKKAEVNLYSRLGVTPWDEFLSQYRQVRKAFQERSEFSRRAMWAQVLTSYGVVPDEGCLAEWEGEYWGMVEAETALFPETMDVLRKLSVKYRLPLSPILGRRRSQVSTGSAGSPAWRSSSILSSSPANPVSLQNLIPSRSVSASRISELHPQSQSTLVMTGALMSVGLGMWACNPYGFSTTP